MNYIRIDEVGGTSLSRVNKLLSGIPGGIWKATGSALKRASEEAKTKAGQFAAAEYTVTKGTFMRNVSVKTHIDSSEGSAVSMSISYVGNVLPLLTFNTRFSRDGRVQTQVKRSGSAAELQHAFVANIYGPAAVFERTGTRRFPVEQKYGPSTAHMMQNDKVIEDMDTTLRDAYEARIEHEITRVMNGWGG